MVPETDIGGAEDGFRPTLWTIVLTAKDTSSGERRQALERLIELYWKPAYFFIRRRGYDVESAKDLTQAFFAAALERDFLKNVSPEKGMFRSFLQASLRYFLSDECDRKSARKRGGGFAFTQAEAELQSPELGPDQIFFRSWAMETMTCAVARLKAECSPEEFALLTQSQTAGLSVTDRKNRLHRLRTRLREHLRDIIRPCVELESDIDEEIRALFSGSA